MNTRLHLVACVALSLGTPPTAEAQWKDVPVSTAVGSQRRSALITDGSGGAVFVWEHNPIPSQVYRGENIFAQHIRADGIAAWATDGVPICTADGYQGQPGIVSDGASGWIVLWTDARSGTASRIYAQRLSSDGNPLWAPNGVVVSSGPSNPGNIDVSSDGEGGALISWANWSQSVGIYAQRLHADGTTWGTDVYVDSLSEDAFGSAESFPRVLNDGFGGCVLTWLDPGRGDIVAQRLDAEGAKLWSEEGVAVCSSHQATTPKGVSLGTGLSMIAWSDDRSGKYALYAQCIDRDGNPVWTLDGIAMSSEVETTNRQFSLTPDDTGGGILTWDDGFIVEPDATKIRAQRVNTVGEKLWGLSGVIVCDGSASRGYPIAASDGAEGAIIAWADARNGGIRAFAQRVSSKGMVEWPITGVPLSENPNTHSATEVISDGAGGEIVAIHADSSDALGAPNDLFAARISHDGSTPVLASLVSAEADAHQVRLRWFMSSASSEISLYRHEAARGWSAATTLTADAAGYVTYDDHDVVTGARYGYRLGVRSHDREVMVGETWVEIPRLLTLAIDGLRPSSGGGLVLAFTVGSAEPTALDVFDPQGRRVLSRDLGRPAPGRHLITLDAMRAALSGFYLLRLRQGEESVTMKAQVLR